MSSLCNIQKINENLSISSQLTFLDIPEIASKGYRSIIANRPDFEGGLNQPTHEEIKKIAEQYGIIVEYQPISGAFLGMEDISYFIELLKKLPKPILAYCRTGNRCRNLYNASQDSSNEIF